METKSGTLYGIGVGPGDPELIPIKAVNLIGKVDIIYTAASTKNNYSNVVCLKAYRNMQSICDALEETGLAKGSVCVANCSRDDEKIYYDLQNLENERPNYWTLIIAKHNRTGR
jgi:precorrin-2 methylase